MTLPDQYGFPSNRRTIPAWGLSAIFHFVLVLILAWAIQPVARGTTEVSERVGGIVLVNNLPNRPPVYTDQNSESESDSSSADSAAAIAGALPHLNELDESLPDFLPSEADLGNLGAELGKSIDGADGFIDGVKEGYKEGVSQDVTTEVFGIKGTGTKFVYAFDRSGSMESPGGRPLAAAKSQLLSSLETLGPKQQFQIIFYNDFPRAFTPNGRKAQLMFATDANKRAARKFVAGISGGGGTHHLSALKMAVDFGPDVVFFLTDADDPLTSDSELDTIDRFNRNAAVIHAIEFGTNRNSSSRSFLKTLARRNGGQYVFHLAR